MSDIRTTIRQVADGYVITMHDFESMVYTCGHVHLDEQSAKAHQADLEDAIARKRCEWCDSLDTAFAVGIGDLDATPDDFVAFCSHACDADATEASKQEDMIYG